MILLCYEVLRVLFLSQSERSLMSKYEDLFRQKDVFERHHAPIYVQCHSRIFWTLQLPICPCLLQRKEFSLLLGSDMWNWSPQGISKRDTLCEFSDMDMEKTDAVKMHAKNCLLSNIQYHIYCFNTQNIWDIHQVNNLIPHRSGYAFINFVDLTSLELFRDRFHGFRQWGIPGIEHVGEVCSCERHQGLSSIIQYYRNNSALECNGFDSKKHVWFQFLDDW